MGSNSHTPPQFAAVAVSLTGNRGAVSMLVSAIDHLTQSSQRGYIQVFTVYPKADTSVELPPRVSLYDGTPQRLLLWLVPLCGLYQLAAFLRLPIIKVARDVQALVEADVILAIGGTTFSDDQLIKVIYNVLCLLPGILLNKPIMLYSQTLGPFQNPINRWVARWALNKVDFVVPRGAGSLKSVEALDIDTPYDYFADAAFTLAIPDDVRQRIRQKYTFLEAHRGSIVGISVNSIVWEKATKAGIPHNQIWANFIQQLRDTGYTILMIPHSMRIGKTSSHNNDLLLVENILSLLPSRTGIHIVAEPYDSKELRVIVGLADYYMASRFHSMISALCEAVPVAVFGWGYHKYWEVLQEFDLGDYCWGASELSLDQLWSAFQRLVADSDAMREKMRVHLPAVQQSSMQNHEMVWRLYETTKNRR